MKTSLLFAKIGIILAASLFGAYMYPQLPDMIPIHWNYAGVVDNYGSKNWVIALFPIIMSVLLLIFYMLPSLDPNKENYPKFAKTWETFQFAFLIFFGYTYIVSLCAALYPTIHVGTYIQSGIGVLFIILGNSLGKIRRNYFIGFKLPWTLSNDDIWNKTHRLGGKMFMLAGVIFLIGAFFPTYPLSFLIASLLFIVCIPTVYSYYLFKKQKA